MGLRDPSSILSGPNHWNGKGRGMFSAKHYGQGQMGEYAEEYDLLGNRLKPHLVEMAEVTWYVQKEACWRLGDLMAYV